MRTTGPRRTTRAQRTRGFTLIELIMVMVISGIILSMGVIRLSGQSIFMAEGESAARRLAADLRHAQSQAIADMKNHYLLFTSDGQKFTEYAIYRVEAGEDVKIEPTRALSDSVAVTGADDRAEFTPGGDALDDYQFGVTSTGRDYTLTVTLATGAVTITEN